MRHAVLHCGHTRYVVEYLVVGVGVQRQRDVQCTDVGVCVRLQVSRLHRRVYVDLSNQGAPFFLYISISEGCRLYVSPRTLYML